MNKIYLAIPTANYNAVVEHFDILNANAFKHAAHSLKSSLNPKKIDQFNNFSTAQKYSTNSKIDNNYENTIILNALSKAIGFKSHAHYMQQQPVIQKLKAQYNLRKYVTSFNQSYGVETNCYTFYEVQFHKLSGQAIYNLSSNIQNMLLNYAQIEPSNNHKLITLLSDFDNLPNVMRIDYDENQCLQNAEEILKAILSSDNIELSLSEKTYTKADFINELYYTLFRKLDMPSKEHISHYNFTKIHDSQCYSTLVPFPEIQNHFIKNNEYHHISDYSDYKIKTSEAVFDTFIKILRALYQEFIKQEEITIHTLKDNDQAVIFSKQNGEYCILVKNQISELLPRQDRLTGLPFHELPYCMQEDYHYEYWQKFEHTKPIYYSPNYDQFRVTSSQYKVQYFNESNNEKHFHIQNSGYQPLRPSKNLRILEDFQDTNFTHQWINNILFHKTSIFGKTIWVSDLVSHDNFSSFINENPNFFNERSAEADQLVINNKGNENIEIIKNEFIHNYNPYREPVDPISVTWFDIVKYLKWFETLSFRPMRLLMPSEFYELRVRGHKDTWLSRDEFMHLKAKEKGITVDDLSENDQEYFYNQYRSLNYDITSDNLRFHTAVDEAEWLSNFRLISTKLMTKIEYAISLAELLARNPQHPIFPDTFLAPPRELSAQNNGHDFGFKTFFRLCFEEPTH